MTSEAVVQGFWKAMGSNDFHAASLCLSEDYRCLWPQSGEIIEGRAAFAEINLRYPAAGPWYFEVLRCVVEGPQVVTDVAVTDGVLKARAITFHTVRNGLITEQVEYWPDPYDAPTWRGAWVRISQMQKMDL
ncbi:nuclear transport factor 2 family protein [Thalassococcus sp. S3]|uniref:nuclear transport factor 2 family protein n=1 Tax=Thalassococcus sp. S3 TaxID=2017482 RepID=UPI001023F5A4|nr:nuclear transport factor 2 family protein [Thalassococcus sp. S3]QBF33721.1 polyketide cyclase [Thalassococcus sp. S3]